MRDDRRKAETPESTSDLVRRAQAGDADALDALLARHLPELRRWASGRLPRWARDIADTTDIVHDTVIVALKHLDGFEHRGDGALQAYLRQGVVNRIRNEIRKRASRGVAESLDSGVHDEGASPLDAAIASQAFARYQAALSRLKPHERAAVIARLEFNLSYEDVAAVLESPTPNAARMTVVRALARLSQDMRHAG